MRKIIFTLLAALSVVAVEAQYNPDVLGRSFEQLTIELPDAYDGPVVTTLVRHRLTKGVKRAVLYVHGYNDYFFQSEMAEQFIDQNWQFYAVDLRRYGRSMREWQGSFDLKAVDEYFEDIDAAIDVMQSEGMEEIVLMGHSTGGLTTSLYCHHNRHYLRVEALILNSPFFDMNLSGFEEAIAVPFASTFASIFPTWCVSKGSDAPGGYGRSVSDQYDGEWAIDTKVKRIESLPITAQWIRAIHRAQRKLQKGLDVPCPVLVLYSDKSVWGDYNEEEYKRGDSVLDVADIAQYAPCVGKNVDQIEVAGGMHDLVLSPAEVRYPLYTTIFDWLNKL